MLWFNGRICHIDTSLLLFGLKERFLRSNYWLLLLLYFKVRGYALREWK